MSREAMDAMNKVVAALKTGAGLQDDFIYYMSFDDYKVFPDPFPRTPVIVREVQETIRRYPNPEKPGELFHVGYSWPVVYPGQSIDPGHRRGDDSRRRRQ